MTELRKSNPKTSIDIPRNKFAKLKVRSHQRTWTGFGLDLDWIWTGFGLDLDS